MIGRATPGKKLVTIFAIIALLAGLAVGGYVIYDRFFTQQDDAQNETETIPEETREVIVDPNDEADTSLREINDLADENRPTEETEFVPDPDNAGITN